jgi:hypothetical protein
LACSVFEMSHPRPRKDSRELCPGVRRAHVDNADRFDPRLRRLNAEQGRGLAAFDAAPEFPLGGDDEVLVERIGMGLDLDPFPAAGNHRKHRTLGTHNPHIVLQLGHVLFRRRCLRKRPRQHELALEHIAAFDATIEGRRHPGKGWMAGPLLDVGDDPTSIGLVPAPIKLLSG